MTLTIEQLQNITPGTPAERIGTFLPYLNKYLSQYGIDKPIEVASFLAQIMHESGGLKYVRELWGPTKQQNRYERDFSQPWPEHRKGFRNWLPTQLGNSEKGDGRKFSGVGLIQTTGRRNMLRMSKDLFGDERLLKQPEILALPEYAVKSACVYWTWKRLDVFDDDLSIKEETLRINGGYNGMEERQKYFERAVNILSVVPSKTK